MYIYIYIRKTIQNNHRQSLRYAARYVMCAHGAPLPVAVSRFFYHRAPRDKAATALLPPRSSASPSFRREGGEKESEPRQSLDGYGGRRSRRRRDKKSAEEKSMMSRSERRNARTRDAREVRENRRGEAVMAERGKYRWRASSGAHVFNSRI